MFSSFFTSITYNWLNMYFCDIVKKNSVLTFNLGFLLFGNVVIVACFFFLQIFRLAKWFKVFLYCHNEQLRWLYSYVAYYSVCSIVTNNHLSLLLPNVSTVTKCHLFYHACFIKISTNFGNFWFKFMSRDEIWWV